MRAAVGYAATSGFRVSGISLINFSFGFQPSSSYGSFTPENYSRPATDLVPRTDLLAQTAKPVKLLKAISRWGNG
jgi:hypothetical protein